MKKSILISFIFFAAVTLSLKIVTASNNSCRGLIQQKKEVASSKVEKVVYTCPMHPEVTMDKPGKCPKCGMNLVKKEAVKVVYTCPMHPEVKKDKPGKCPKCGMDLVKKEPSKNETPQKAKPIKE